MKELDLSKGHLSGIPIIQEKLERMVHREQNSFTNEDRRAMGIRIPIHLAFLEEKENVIEISEEKLKTYMSEVSKKKLGRIVKIIKMISENPYISINEMKT